MSEFLLEQINYKLHDFKENHRKLSANWILDNTEKMLFILLHESMVLHWLEYF